MRFGHMKHFIKSPFSLGVILAALLGAIGISPASDETTPPAPSSPPPCYDRSKFPEPIFDQEPGYVDLYWKSCDLAAAHVLNQPGLPSSPYMDEAFADQYIWIWDSCFMALFCRYSQGVLPGIESLSNFYAAIHDGSSLTANYRGDSKYHVLIRHSDNPPLFAWVEWQHFQMTGDKDRIRWLLKEKQYLQKHYQWFRSLKHGELFPFTDVPIILKPQPLGFEWGGVASGMDNSPRFGAPGLLAIDAISQQGLSAKYIALLAKAIGDTALQSEYETEYKRICDLVNEHYWDEEDGFYYDLLPDGHFSKVRTPASFWPVLAGMATPQKVDRMAQRLKDSDDLGGSVPWVSLSRSDKAFDSQTGNYWRGAVWLPTAYMGIRALTENGQGDLADKTAEQLLRHMYLTYRDYSPHTLWEAYNPIQPIPAYYGTKIVKPDFCGWSALGPISLFIENVIGIHSVNASERVVEWRLHQPGRHGVRNFRFADVATDLVADGQGHVDVTSNSNYILIINGKRFKVEAGTRRFAVPSVPSSEQPSKE